MKIKLLTLTIMFVIQGCSIMPYKEESACQFNDYGKCLPLNKAYKEAVTGVNQGGTLVNGEGSLNNDKYSPNTNKIDVNYENQQTYQKSKALITLSGEMPLLKPAVVRRIFINSYKTADSSIWHEPKNIYYIESKPKWELETIKRKSNQGALSLF